MQDPWESKGKKIHTRKIEIATYAYDGQRILVEGLLRDDRFQDSYLLSCEKLPRGVVHHMTIRLLVNCANLMIEDVDVQMDTVPGGDACRETLDSLAPLKGLTITRGFMVKVKKLVGGVKGCTHLVELIQTMAPAVIQGLGTYQALKPAPFNPERAKKFVQYLINTCHTWRDGGPFVEKFTTKIHEEQAAKTGKSG
ncbi:MAG: DUF2889 domain-containing protein [Deltaproteobacteria bacterium]|nr:DUF2889 domain-containing protein [Deltaproteobacteria bacterium]